MTRMSKDHRSAGLRWSLPLSAGATADGFVPESTVTSGQRGGPAFFFIILCFHWCCRRRFPGGKYHDCWMSPGSLRYHGLGLDNGLYNVSLFFAEIGFKARNLQTWESQGRRVFDIYIQGSLESKDFDISKEAGGVERAIRKNFMGNVAENYLEIHLFWAGKGTCCIPDQGYYGPLISAIHVASDFVSTVPGILPSTPGEKSRLGLIVGITVPVGVVTLSLIFAVFYMKRKSPHFNEEGKSITAVGTLSDGRIVAVKQLSVTSHQGKSQFENEISTISAVQHRNLVKLNGCCIDGDRHLLVALNILKTDRHLLVYEYLENRSLDLALFGKSNLHLDWPTRFNVCLGTTRGLAYLHKDSRPRIVHRDVKASNILIDGDLCPKISDFGLAKLYDYMKTHISTRVARTIGYLAPEYAMLGHLTEKADVFSFGVVALEILSGRPNSDNSLDNKKKYLLEWASPMMRPSMSRVVAMLVGDIEVGVVTSMPSYLTDWNFKDITSSFLSEEDRKQCGDHSNTNSELGDPMPSPVNVTETMLGGIIGDGSLLLAALFYKHPWGFESEPFPKEKVGSIPPTMRNWKAAPFSPLGLCSPRCPTSALAFFDSRNSQSF
uniref:non-specific serine/threonine protein kinase n=1 Tax=Fagus sylvatica TaxID=28930 RepID=A0A2N9FD04_FAGSY